MQKIIIGGFHFQAYQRWEEVSQPLALKLFGTTPRQRAALLLEPPLPLDLHDDQIGVIDAIISFAEECPPTSKTYPFERLSFKQFEFIRQAIAKHPDSLGCTLGRVAYIMNYKGANYVEFATSVLGAVFGFVEAWQDTELFHGKELTQKEKDAGAERLQAFGSYGILEAVASKYGKLPKDIENEPAAWVFQEWYYNIVKQDIQSKL